MLFFVTLSLPAAAQFQITFNYVFSPPSPRPGDHVTVFIRATDSVNGFVFCPETAQVITHVGVEGTSIILDLYPLHPPGGFVEPFCDGNTVSLGALQAGLYSVIARPVLPNGMPGPALLTGLLAVGQVPVPVFSLPWLFLCAFLILLTGSRLVVRRGPPWASPPHR